MSKERDKREQNVARGFGTDLEHAALANVVEEALSFNGPWPGNLTCASAGFVRKVMLTSGSRLFHQSTRLAGVGCGAGNPLILLSGLEWSAIVVVQHKAANVVVLVQL